MSDSRKPDDQWDFLIDKDKKIGYIRISNFIANTVEELKKALAELKADGMQGLVLDLRDDPGGLLSSAVEVSDLFIDEGVIVSTKGRNTPKKTYEARKDGAYTNFPMVVLVNRFSASASEIVAACLQDHDRALVVGERSYGKGSVQNIFDLDDGNSVLKLTVASYYRPSGKNIHRFKNAKESDEWGVSPNPGMEVKLSGGAYHAWATARRDRDMQSNAKGRRAANKPEGDKPKDEGEKPKKAEDEKPKKAEGWEAQALCGPPTREGPERGPGKLAAAKT